MAGLVQTVKNTIAENVGGPSHALALPEHQFSLSEVPDQSNKVAVVTGGTRGIAYACTHTLLSKNIAKVFVIARAADAYEDAKASIARDLGEDKASRLVWKPVDLADWKKTAAIAGEIAEETDRIDIFIGASARGIMTYEKTDYGVDRHMAVNHMGHSILISHLLPVFKKTAEKGNTVRIVLFGSNAHQATPSDCKFESLDELNTDLGPNGQYGRSKLAQMLYAKYLTKTLHSKYPKILANSIHPGFVETKMSVEDIHEPYPIMGYAMSVGMKPFKKSQWQGAVSAMYCATKTEKSGEYVCPPAIPETGSSLYVDEDGKLQENLMNLTEKIISEKFPVESVKKGCPMEFS